MKILQICHKPPFPPSDGGAKAQYQLTRLLVIAGFQVDILTISTEKHPFSSSEIPDWFSQQGKIKPVQFKANPNFIGFIKSIFVHDSYILGRYKTNDFKNALHQINNQSYGLVIFDGLISAAFVNEIKLPKVYRSHNLEYKIWQTLAENSGFIKKWYLNLQAKKLKNEETRIIKTVDQVWHLNADEIPLFPHQNKVQFLPVSLPLNNLPEVKFPAKFTAGFIGAFHWLPNQEAVNFIAQNLADKLSHEHTDVCIAGRHQPKNFFNLKYLKNLGEVNQLSDFFDEISVFVNPIFSGSGVKIKLIDAVLHQKPIISTQKGTEGLNFIPGQHYLQAETSQQFLDAILQLKTNKTLGQTLSKNALNQIKSTFSEDEVVELLLQTVKPLL